MENGAGNGDRTRDPKLGKLVLYQLSYARTLLPAPCFGSIRGYFVNSEKVYYIFENDEVKQFVASFPQTPFF